MKRKVCLFEFSTFQGVFPLASGYMEAAACVDPELRSAYEFKKYSFATDNPDIEAFVRRTEADLFGFSCYVWNIGLVRRLLPTLMARRPQPHVILGGPQVMHRSHIYLRPDQEKVLVCNGEGERTFPNVLRQLRRDQPDFSAVRGLSFYANGELVTTPHEARIGDLDEIPSPYLGGYMERGSSVWAVLETNRGCPFKCTYCYWGGATNSKVHKYSEDRIFKEITWCSENNVLYIFIADANFGMLKRDVEIAKHLAECKRKTGLPLAVQFSSSKNTPERVSEIATIFADANLVSTQPISLQTMNENTLAAVKRENIRTASYTQLQNVLNDRNVSSFIEMIWPLPGETLESFKDGIGTLCDAGADSYHFYPLMIIGNVEMESQVDEFGLVTVEDPDVNSEARLVIQTKDVTRAQYLDGVRFTYHVTSLHVLRSLWHVLKFLAHERSISYARALSQFADYCATRADNPYVQVIEETLRTFRHHRFTAEGAIMFSVLHANRPEFDALLVDFVRSKGWLDDIQIELRLELDLLNRPYVFSTTPVQQQSVQLLSVVWTNGKTRLIRIPQTHRRLVGTLLGLGELESGYVTVDYGRNQMPFMQGKSLEDNFAYCQDRLSKMRALLPTWSVATSLSAETSRKSMPSYRQRNA
jgi:radical SAM superfamily enzyme YgiQ (UPF0313 family)